MMMTEGQKYLRLMLAFDGLVDGKGLTGRVIDKDDYGREFAIDAVLANTTFVRRCVFDDSDIAQVKAAFAAVGKLYPGNSIEKCVEALLRS
jgi:hypothetical protein